MVYQLHSFSQGFEQFKKTKLFKPEKPEYVKIKNRLLRCQKSPWCFCRQFLGTTKPSVSSTMQRVLARHIVSTLEQTHSVACY